MTKLLIPLHTSNALVKYDATAHYALETGPVDQFHSFDECDTTIRNIGWTLGNDCPYRCTHCYSFVARRKGRNMSIPMVDRIIQQLSINGVRTVNLGGNEPLFTNGPDPRKTLLPYIIESLVEAGIEVGLTTSGITLVYLHKYFYSSFELLNDVDISFDSPYEDEHNRNRGANLYQQALNALRLCQEAGKPHTCIMTGMNWNFTEDRLLALVEIARKFSANIRINPVKPVEPEHMALTLSPEQYYNGFALLMQICDSIDLGEPPLSAITDYINAQGCPCGRTSFRIHSITPDGAVYVSPCVYLHDYKCSMDLLKYDLADIIKSPQFKVFRQRNQHPELVDGCSKCDLLRKCKGGCAARAYLHAAHATGVGSMRARDPYCPIRTFQGQKFPQRPNLVSDQMLVHTDYLCTWIGRPKQEKDW